MALGGIANVHIFSQLHKMWRKGAKKALCFAGAPLTHLEPCACQIY